MAVLSDPANRRVRWAGALSAVLALALCHASLLAQVYNEPEVKAAFLYHFTSYVQYPASAFENSSSPYVIGILGKTDVAKALQEAIRGKTAMGRQIVVKQVVPGQELRMCHMLFVADSEARHLPKILDILGDAPVLTVGESAGFAGKGGIIGFFVEQNRLRFEVNLEAARRANLNISSKLLSLARIVKGDRRG